MKKQTKEDIDEQLRQDILKQLARFIEADFGEECDDFEECCCVCEAHKALKVLQRLYKPL